jgi:SAM-dependent methyltransferase
MSALPVITLCPGGTVHTASSRLRCHVLARELSRLGCTTHLGLPSGADARPLPDVLYVQKLVTREILAHAKAVRAHGGQVVYDIDDWGDALGNLCGEPAVFAEFIAQCAAVSVDTAVRKDVFAKEERFASVPDFWVVPDPIDYVDALADADTDRPPAAGLHGCWFGNGPNVKPAIPYMQAAMQSGTLSSFGVITNAGLVPQLQAAWPMLSVEAWQLETFAQRLRASDFCLLIHDTNLEGVQKSNNKMLAALGQGVVPLVSNTPAYAETAQRIGIPELLLDSPADLAARLQPEVLATLRAKVRGEACRRALCEFLPATIARGFLDKVVQLHGLGADARADVVDAPAAEATAAPKPAPERGLSLLLDLLYPAQRSEALDQLRASGFINDQTLPTWAAELGQARYQSRLLNFVLAPEKIRLDRELEQLGGELTRKKTGEIVQRLLKLLDASGRAVFGQHDAIGHRTVLDFGAGVYSPLSTSIVLYANGYQQAIACEPFPIHVDFAAASVAQTLQWLMLDPGALCFSGIAPQALRQRLALLDLHDLPARLEAFNAGTLERLDLHGVVLVKSLQHQSADSVDLVFSNSTLEHVQDLPLELQRHHRALRDDGICVHTVDFSDHRAIGTGLHIFQMYYDGVLDGINGWRPPQLERAFQAAGFAGVKLPQLSTPVGYVHAGQALRPPFAGFSDEELSVWVTSYVLSKRAG